MYICIYISIYILIYTHICYLCISRRAAPGELTRYYPPPMCTPFFRRARVLMYRKKRSAYRLVLLSDLSG